MRITIWVLVTMVLLCAGMGCEKHIREVRSPTVTCG
jgi:hypothetical protein